MAALQSSSNHALRGNLLLFDGFFFCFPDVSLIDSCSRRVNLYTHSVAGWLGNSDSSASNCSRNSCFWKASAMLCYPLLSSSMVECKDRLILRQHHSVADHLVVDPFFLVCPGIGYPPVGVIPEC